MNEVMEKLGEFINKSMDAMYEKGKRDTVDALLKIIDRYYLWNLDERGNYVTVSEEIKAAVLALKGGDKG